jgi:hypothetical protein
VQPSSALNPSPSKGTTMILLPLLSPAVMLCLSVSVTANVKATTRSFSMTTFGRSMLCQLFTVPSVWRMKSSRGL